MFRKIDRGEIKGLLSICFNPMVSLPDSDFITRMLEKLEFYVAIDFFLNETARHADVVLPGSLHEEDEGTVTQTEGRVIKINKAVDCPGDARQDWRIIQDIAAGARPARTGSPSTARARSSTSCGVASKGGVADYSGITYEKIERQMGVFWPCPTTRRSRSTPGTPRLFEPGSWNPVAKGAGPFYFPDGKARFNVADVPRRRPRTSTTSIPLILTTGPRRQPVPVGHADAAHRPAGRPVPRAAHRDAPAAGGEARHRRRRLGDGRDRAAARMHAPGAGGDDDPPGHDLHPVPLGRARRASNQLTDRGAGPDLEDPRVQGLRGAACARPTARRSTPAVLEPQQ